MFLPSGDQSSPLASVAIEVSLCTPVTVPFAPSKSAIQTCEPPSFVEIKAKRLPSGAQRGRSPSWSGMSTRSLSPTLPETGEEWATPSFVKDSPTLPFGEGWGTPACVWLANGTIQMCGVLAFFSRSTSTALNKTHLPSGEGTGSPTRLSFIMSSKVKGRLACE
jgi:hypothetical protein